MVTTTPVDSRSLLDERTHVAAYRHRMSPNERVGDFRSVEDARDRLNCHRRPPRPIAGGRRGAWL